MVYIELENFKRYENTHRFNLPELGFILLSGNSGIGKTSILEGINFALYGNGNKVVNFSSNKCRVVFRFHEFKITRTKRPNRLVLDVFDYINEDEDSSAGISFRTYEDQVAQEIINQHFGQDFEITSYIKQKDRDKVSFYRMGPTAKMEFLQKIALNDNKILEIKNKTKDIIRTRKELLNNVSTQFQIISEEFTSMIKPEIVKSPIGSITDIKLKNHQTKIKNNVILAKKARKRLESILKEDKQQDLMILKRKNIMEKIIKLEREIEINKENINEWIISTEVLNLLNEFILELNKYKTYLILEEEIEENIEELNTQKQKEDEKVKSELCRLKSIPLILDKSDYYKNQIQIYREINQAETKILNFTYDLNDVEYVNDDEIQILTDKITTLEELKTCYECPNCQVLLKMLNKKLVLAEIKLSTSLSDIDKELQKIKNKITVYKKDLEKQTYLKRNIQSYSSILDKYKDFNKNINYEDEYKEHIRLLNQQKINLDKIKELENYQYSDLVKKLTESLKVKRDKISRINYKQEYMDQITDKIIEQIDNKILLELKIINKDNEFDLDDLDLDLLNLKYNEYKLNNQKQDMLKELVNKYIKEKNFLEKELDDMSESSLGKDFTVLIEEVKSELNNLELEEKALKDQDNKINEYLSYKEKFDNYKKWENKYNESRIREREAEINLEISERFLKIINETESKAVTNIINNINMHLKYYSEKFFTEPILIYIQPFKENANGNIKPSITIKLSYKGIDYDIDYLSGGQEARIELAICLTMNNIVNSKILLLDEVLNCLNTEYIENIIDIIKEDALKNNKLILTVLHQAPEGCFDEVVNVV